VLRRRIHIMARNKDPHEADGLAGLHAQTGANGFNRRVDMNTIPRVL